MAKGFKCDLCGKLHEGEPWVVNGSAVYPLMKPNKPAYVQFGKVPFMDVCKNCGETLNMELEVLAAGLRFGKVTSIDIRKGARWDEVEPLLSKLIEWVTVQTPNLSRFKGVHVIDIVLVELARLTREADECQRDLDYLSILESLADSNQLARAQAMLAEKAAERDGAETTSFECQKD